MSEQTVAIKRALISVTDKSGLERLGQNLVGRGVHILSSGGTAKFLRDHKIPVEDVSDFSHAHDFDAMPP